MHARDLAEFQIPPKTAGLFVFHLQDRAENDVDNNVVTATAYLPTGQQVASAVACQFLVSGDYGLPIDADWSVSTTAPPKEILGVFYADITTDLGPDGMFTDRLYWLVDY
jgi:hypothetical protein